MGILKWVYKIYPFLQMGIFFANGYILLNIPKKKTNARNAHLALLNTLLASQNLFSALQITSDDPKTLLVPFEQTVATYPKTKTF